MKKSIIISIAFLLFSIISVNTSISQEDALLNNCTEFINAPFVVSGQPFKAFLTDDEVAEFRTTLFAGTTYRIVACSHQEQNIIFSVYDKERNLLFSNNSYENANYWDFKVEGSIECIVEAKLNTKKSTSGIALLLVGFKYSIQ